mgnify:CR=1 FL=1
MVKLVAPLLSVILLVQPAVSAVTALTMEVKAVIAIMELLAVMVHRAPESMAVAVAAAVAVM